MKFKLIHKIEKVNDEYEYPDSGIITKREIHTTIHTFTYNNYVYHREDTNGVITWDSDSKYSNAVNKLMYESDKLKTEQLEDFYVKFIREQKLNRVLNKLEPKMIIDRSPVVLQAQVSIFNQDNNLSNIRNSRLQRILK